MNNCSLLTGSLKGPPRHDHEKCMCNVLADVPTDADKMY